MRRLIGDVDRGRLDAFEELCAPDYACHSAGSPTPLSREQHKQEVLVFYAAFPDLHHLFEDMIAEGDRVAVRMTYEGTHKGSFQGIPPTGKRVSFPGILILRIAGGKVAEMWRCIDLLELLRQLGAPPVQQ